LPHRLMATQPPPGTGEFDFKTAQKGQRSAFMTAIGFVDRQLNRRAAALLVRAVYRTRVTPNQLTWVSAAIGCASGALFAQGEPGFFLLAGVAAQLSSIIDGADGMLARARGECSEYGSHLDLFLDRVIDFSIFAGLALGASRHFQAPHLLNLGLLAAGLYQLQIILFYLTKSFLKSPERGDTGEARAVLYWAVLVAGVTGRPDVFIYLLLAETLVLNTFRLGYFVGLGRR
jgi:phosphatidylglycerophosphate synthase